MTTKTKAKPKAKPAPAPATAPEVPAVTTSEDLSMQCNRCSELIDSLEAQLDELETQHQEHERVIATMQSEQAIRHESYDALKRAISETSECITGLKMSLAVTRDTPSEAATQAMLEQHQKTLEGYKAELRELEALDVKRGESDSKSAIRHEKALEELEEQYASLEGQRDELVKQHDTLYEELGWMLYHEFEAATARLQDKIEQADAERRGQMHAYEYAKAELRQEALKDLADWPHVIWRVEAIQKNVDAQKTDERHEKNPLVVVLRAHQNFLRALQLHGNALRQRRYGSFDLVQVLEVNQQLIGECLMKQLDLKPRIDLDDTIIEKHT